VNDRENTLRIMRFAAPERVLTGRMRGPVDVGPFDGKDSD
jgi:hypothetical protein